LSVQVTVAVTGANGTEAESAITMLNVLPGVVPAVVAIVRRPKEPVVVLIVARVWSDVSQENDGDDVTS